MEDSQVLYNSRPCRQITFCCVYILHTLLPLPLNMSRYWNECAHLRLSHWTIPETSVYLSLMPTDWELTTCYHVSTLYKCYYATPLRTILEEYILLFYMVMRYVSWLQLRNGSCFLRQSFTLYLHTGESK